MRFRAASYWDVAGEFAVAGGGFGATLTSLGGVRIATGKDFDRDGGVSRGDVIVLDRAGADDVVAALTAAAFSIRSAERDAHRRSPPPPSRAPQGGRHHPTRDEASLYELVWMRTVASQMSDAVGESVQVRLGAAGASGRGAEVSTSGKIISFSGF